MYKILVMLGSNEQLKFFPFVSFGNHEKIMSLHMNKLRIKATVNLNVALRLAPRFT